MAVSCADGRFKIRNEKSAYDPVALGGCVALRVSRFNGNIGKISLTFYIIFCYLPAFRYS